MGRRDKECWPGAGTGRGDASYFVQKGEGTQPTAKGMREGFMTWLGLGDRV